MTSRAVVSLQSHVEGLSTRAVGTALLLGLTLGGCGGTSNEPRPQEPDAATTTTTDATDASAAPSPDGGITPDGGVTTGGESGNTLDVTLELTDAASDAALTDSDPSDARAGTRSDAAAAHDAGFDAAVGNNPSDAAVECVPTNPTTETCDGRDNDCNGLVDDVDALGDGIFDCLQIALFGNAGQYGSADFVAWLGQQGPMGVTRVQTDQSELTADSLTGLSIIILDRLIRPYTEQEAQLLAAWVEQGGGLIVMTGYSGGNTDVDYPNSLLTPYGVGFAPELQSGPVTVFSEHSTVSELTSVTFSGGHEVLLEAPDSSPTAFESVATLPSGDVGAAAGAYGAGRVFLWGDEWIEFDSEWSSQPDVPQLWANVTSWVAHLSN